MSQYFPAGVLEYRVIVRDGLDSLSLYFELPNGTTSFSLPITTGATRDLGTTSAGQGTLFLTDATFGLTFDDSDPLHCVVAEIDGGWRYSWDDAGSADHDYNDIIVEITKVTQVGTTDLANHNWTPYWGVMGGSDEIGAYAAPSPNWATIDGRPHVVLSPYGPNYRWARSDAWDSMHGFTVASPIGRVYCGLSTRYPDYPFIGLPDYSAPRVGGDILSSVMTVYAGVADPLLTCTVEWYARDGMGGSTLEASNLVAFGGDVTLNQYVDHTFTGVFDHVEFVDNLGNRTKWYPYHHPLRPPVWPSAYPDNQAYDRGWRPEINGIWRIEEDHSFTRVINFADPIVNVWGLCEHPPGSGLLGWDDDQWVEVGDGRLGAPLNNFAQQTYYAGPRSIRGELCFFEGDTASLLYNKTTREVMWVTAADSTLAWHRHDASVGNVGSVLPTGSTTGCMNFINVVDTADGVWVAFIEHATSNHNVILARYDNLNDGAAATVTYTITANNGTYFYDGTSVFFDDSDDIFVFVWDVGPPAARRIVRVSKTTGAQVEEFNSVTYADQTDVTRLQPSFIKWRGKMYLDNYFARFAQRNDNGTWTLETDSPEYGGGPFIESAFDFDFYRVIAITPDTIYAQCYDEEDTIPSGDGISPNAFNPALGIPTGQGVTNSVNRSQMPNFVARLGTGDAQPPGGCTVHVEVFAQDGVTFIAHVPRRRNVRWLDEVNAAGTGQFDLHTADAILVAHPSLLDQYNVVKMFLNGVAIKAWLIEDVSPVRVGSGGQADEWVTVTGRGIISALEAAVVYPEYGLRELVSEDRNFNFASKDGVWRNPSEWVAGVGVLWPNDTTPARKTYPKNWPDPLAYWVWSSNPNANAPAGNNWLRGTFTLTATTPVIIYATADNGFQMYLDGEIIVASDPTTEWAFRTRYEYRITLAAGTHTLAAIVYNITNSPSPAGFIATIFRTSATGDPTGTNIFRTKPSNMIVKPYGDPPGWHGATILRQCVIEAQDRQVTSLVPVTFGFDNLVDSNGQPWFDIQERTVKVGTTDLFDLATQIVETTLDIELDPNFVLQAWKKRGRVRPNVRLLPSRDLTAAHATIRAGKLRNQALLKFDGGWMELFSAASKDLFGRREVGLSVGTSTSTYQTELVGKSALQEVGRPEITIPLSFTCVRGPQPYSDFFLGDIITVPDAFGGLTKARLMSITGSEEESLVVWDLDFYPEQNNDQIDVVVVATGGSFQDQGELYKEEVLSDSPWGYWRLQETATPLKDSSGHLRSLVVTGSPLYNQPGPIDRAMLFSQLTTQYAESSAGSRYKLGYNTLEAWVYVEDLPTANRSNIIGMAVEYDSVSFDKALGVNPDGTLYYYVFNGTQRFVTSTTALALNTWYHVAGSVGPKGLRLYINGALVRTVASVTTSYTASGQRVYVRGGGNNFNQLDRVRVAEPAVYFQQLLDSRLLAHYRASGVTP